MRIPKNVKIIGFNWRVKVDDNVANEGSVFGSTHTATQTIFLEDGGTTQKREQTFLHECMHAIWWQTGLGKRYPELKQEEEIISALASGLYQVLTENKMLK